MNARDKRLLAKCGDNSPATGTIDAPHGRQTNCPSDGCAAPRSDLILRRSPRQLVAVRPVFGPCACTTRISQPAVASPEQPGSNGDSQNAHKGRACRVHPQSPGLEADRRSQHGPARRSRRGWRLSTKRKGDVQLHRRSKTWSHSEIPLCARRWRRRQGQVRRE